MTLSGLQFQASSLSTVAHTWTQTGWQAGRQAETHGITWERSIKTRLLALSSHFPCCIATSDRACRFMEAHKLGRKNFNQMSAFTSTSSLSLGLILDEDEELQVALRTLDLLFPSQALIERSHNLNDPKSIKISRKTA